jgi:hypothetical protein
MADSFPSIRPIELRQALVEILVKELKRIYDIVEEYPAVVGSVDEPEGMRRIVVRWYDNSPVARILLGPDDLIVELGPRRTDGWKRVVHIRYQDPMSIERILELVGTADPGIY